MKIDCRRCEMYRTEHCDGCLVTALLHPPTGEVEIDDDLGEGLETLSGAGLVPALRFRLRDDAGDVGDGDADAAQAG